MWGDDFLGFSLGIGAAICSEDILEVGADIPFVVVSGVGVVVDRKGRR